MPLFTAQDVPAAVARAVAAPADLGPSRPVDGSGSFGAQNARRPYGGQAPDGYQPTVITSNLWMLQQKFLVLHAGIQSANWGVKIRAASEEVKGGHARFAVPRTGHHGQRTWLGEPTVSLTLQTGNLLPIEQSGSDVRIPYGLEDFYHFLDLINQPPIVPRLSGFEEHEGRKNYVIVHYHSLQFPQIELRGYVDPEGVSWTDAAEQPTEFTWNCSMEIHHSNPDLTNVEDLLRSYTETMRTITSSRQF